MEDTITFGYYKDNTYTKWTFIEIQYFKIYDLIRKHYKDIYINTNNYYKQNYENLSNKQIDELIKNNNLIYHNIICK